MYIAIKSAHFTIVGFLFALKKRAQSRFLSVTESRKIDTEQRE